MPSIDHEAVTASTLASLLDQESVTIPVTSGETTIDTADLLNVHQAGPWRKHPTRGYIMRDNWNITRHCSTIEFLHTFLTGWSLVDHINGDVTDNRRSNLREATPSQNGANRRIGADNTSGYKGVSRDRSRWIAHIKENRVTHTLGSFDTPEDAARAYDDAAVRYFGEYAALNFPRDGYRCIREEAA